MRTLQSWALQKLMLSKIKRMTGHEPVGMNDLISLLVHPDMIVLTHQLVHQVEADSKIYTPTDEDVEIY